MNVAFLAKAIVLRCSADETIRMWVVPLRAVANAECRNVFLWLNIFVFVVVVVFFIGAVLMWLYIRRFLIVFIIIKSTGSSVNCVIVNVIIRVIYCFDFLFFRKSFEIIDTFSIVFALTGDNNFILWWGHLCILLLWRLLLWLWGFRFLAKGALSWK